MARKTAHVISHTHWDREWYLPFERHHVRLVQLMDRLLGLLEADAGFASFHLDGQTIVLDDYLQVRPEMRERIITYVREGRLFVGPWYVLQDEFLTSSEANVRNLLVGLREAARYGGATRIGYFPDAFGNMGQAPQLLAQAGITAAVFGRGVRPIGFNNTVQACERYESPFSEMVWQAPDGSRVLGILFANWYHNGMEIPVEEGAAWAYWEARLPAVERFAATDHLLFMNGCDHQPVQADLSAALATARRCFPGVEFVHSNFPAYVQAVQQAAADRPLAVIDGELRSQQTDGWWTLVNTASARIYLKQMNQRGQALLERQAEPLAALAHTLGVPYPGALLTYAWKTLMQNHPHDSICGCSVDEVHREMVTRFAKSRTVAEALITESAREIAARVDTTGFGEAAVPFVLFNTSGWARSGVVAVELELSRRHDGFPTAAHADLAAQPLGDWHLVDAHGTPLPCAIEDLGVQFGYELPDDRFRQPYMALKVRLTFNATEVPALGYASFALRPGAMMTDTTSLVCGERAMENARLRVLIQADGTLDITDKATGHTFTGLGAYEDVGDVGNEYLFVQPIGDTPICSRGVPASIELVEDTPWRATYAITHRLTIPAAAEPLLAEERAAMVPCTERKARRGAEMVALELVTRVSLERDASAVQVSVTFDNPATDHRLRVLFPSGLDASTHRADSIFEVAVRDNVPAPGWQNPSNCQHQQAFVSIDDGRIGLTIANQGLPEYEVLRDGANTIALTLLRAVGELGDWGVFPTPEAQCPGTHTAAFAIIPHAGDVITSAAFVEAYQCQAEMVPCQTSVHPGALPPAHTFLPWHGPTLALTALKKHEETADLLARWVNLSLTPCTLTVQPAAATVYASNIVEERGDTLAPTGQGEWEIPVAGARIVTVGFTDTICAS